MPARLPEAPRLSESPSFRVSGQSLRPFPAQPLGAPRAAGPRLMLVCPVQDPTPTPTPTPVPTPPQGLCSPSSHWLGAPAGQSICGTLALSQSFPRADSLSQVLTTPPRGISTFHFIRGLLRRLLMRMLSGHTQPDSSPEGGPAPTPSIP